MDTFLVLHCRHPGTRQVFSTALGINIGPRWGDAAAVGLCRAHGVSSGLHRPAGNRRSHLRLLWQAGFFPAFSAVALLAGGFLAGALLADVLPVGDPWGLLLAGALLAAAFVGVGLAFTAVGVAGLYV
jgi:hypothetical protein